MSYTKSAHASFVSPEHIKLNTYYALTLNPSDKFQFIKTPDRFNHFRNCFDDLLYRLIDTSEYKMYVESSDTGRLHLHGIIRFTEWSEAQQFYTFLMKIKDLCTFMFSNEDQALSDEKKEIYQTWRNYMKKQKSFWSHTGIETLINGSENKTITSNTKYDISKYF